MNRPSTKRNPWKRLLAPLAVGLLAAVILALAPDAPPASAGEVGVAPRPAKVVRPRGDRPLVVLDPGHGGSNTGAPAALAGLYEKQLTLVLARDLARELDARGVDVVLTRERDEMVSLRRRTALANQLGAAAFVSLHANASPDHGQRGYETWIASPEAIDRDARAIRSGDGRARPGLDRATALLVEDVARGAAQDGSIALARAIQAALARAWGAPSDRGIRQGSKDVLLGAEMPAVLVEVGFIDHPDEGAALLTTERRHALARELAAAIAETVAR